MYMADLSKGYDMPIVAKAVVAYFLEDKPVLETLYEATNILDFVKLKMLVELFMLSLQVLTVVITTTKCKILCCQ